MRNTYFVTFQTFNRKRLFQNHTFAELLIEILFRYREQQKFSLHEFVVMPDHMHLIITPGGDTTLERAVQFVKGGCSYELRKRLGFGGEVWQTSFQDRRIRDGREYAGIARYIRNNPVQARLSESPESYPFSSAHFDGRMDSVLQGLKPLIWTMR